MRTALANKSVWELKRIKYLATYNDEALPDNTESDLEINYIEISDVDHVKGITNSQILEFEKAPSRARRIVRKGDTIVSTVRTYLKAIAYIDKRHDNSIVSTGFAVIRSIDEDKIDPKFLSYCFLDKRLIGDIISYSVGVSYPAINASGIVRLSIYQPSFSEQTLIVRFLDQKTSQIDKLIEQKEKLLKLLNEKRTAIITQAVTKGLDPTVEMKDSGIDWLGKIPKNWKTLKLRYLGRMKSGEGITTLEMNEDYEYPVYGGNGFRGYASTFTHEGDYVLIGRQGALCGNINYASGKFWASEHAVVVTLADNVDLIWLGELLRIMNLNQYSVSAAQPGLAIDRIQELIVPFPPFSEQKIISKYLYSLNSKSSLDDKIRYSIDKLKEYREALITSAVTGQIDVRKEISHE